MNEIIKGQDSGIIPYKLLTELYGLYLYKKHNILSNDLTAKDETKEMWVELNDEIGTFLKKYLQTKMFVASGFILWLILKSRPICMVF